MTSQLFFPVLLSRETVGIRDGTRCPVTACSGRFTRRSGRGTGERTGGGWACLVAGGRQPGQQRMCLQGGMWVLIVTGSSLGVTASRISAPWGLLYSGEISHTAKPWRGQRCPFVTRDRMDGRSAVVHDRPSSSSSSIQPAAAGCKQALTQLPIAGTLSTRPSENHSASSLCALSTESELQWENEGRAAAECSQQR